MMYYIWIAFLLLVAWLCCYGAAGNYTDAYGNWYRRSITRKQQARDATELWVLVVVVFVVIAFVTGNIGNMISLEGCAKALC